jgi:apolipoprotein N-acyltransferase
MAPPRPRRFIALLRARPTLTCFVLGGLLPLAFAPVGWWWLAPLLVAGQALVWFGMPPRGAFRAGFAFGAGAFLTGTYWLYIAIHTIGNAPVWLALILMLGLVAIMAAYYGATAAIVARAAGENTLHAALLLVPAWVVLEWLRGWLLSGFPWLSLGYTTVGTPFAGFVPLGGVYLASLAVVSIAAAFCVIAAGGRRARIAAIVALVAVPAAGQAMRAIAWTDVRGAPLRVAVAQAAVPQEIKWLPDQLPLTIAWYRDFVLEHAGADVLLMPEVAIPALQSRVQPQLDQLASIARRGGSDLFTGILRMQADGRITNSVVGLGPEDGVYDKRHLVPFGEYFPVPAFVREWMRLRGLPFSDLSPGAYRQPEMRTGGVPLAFSICYEDAYGAEQRVFFPRAQLLINVSNDAWFGDSIAPHQHLQIARTRSLEARRWQLRSTNTGITAIIDADGTIRGAAPQFEPDVVSGTVTPRGGHTPYTRFGNWPVVTICMVLLAALTAARRR